MCPRVQSRCYWYLICSRGVNWQLLTFTEPVLSPASPTVSSTLTRTENLAHWLPWACLCKRKIYHCWFDQTFLGHEIESKEQAKLLLNAQYGIEAQTRQGFFLDSFFPGALSVTFSFWKTLLSELVEPKRCRFFYQSGTKSLLVSQRHSCKAEQQLGNVTGWRQRSLCPSSASKKSALKVTLEQNINHQSILQCEEPHYWIHDDQLKNLKDKYLALQFMPLVTSSASWNCNWWVTLSPI